MVHNGKDAPDSSMSMVDSHTLVTPSGEIAYRYSGHADHEFEEKPPMPENSTEAYGRWGDTAFASAQSPP